MQDENGVNVIDVDVRFQDDGVLDTDYVFNEFKQFVKIQCKTTSTPEIPCEKFPTLQPILSVKNGPGTKTGDSVYCTHQTTCDPYSTICLPESDGNYSCDCQD